VLALVTQAKTNKEIAHDLGISPATVKRHLENVLGKLGLRNRVEAAIYGILLNGCAGGVGSGCALQAWRQEREMTAAIPTESRDHDTL
jgi:predicted ArsR family transcriptional regulator